ncbi:hypothetical protein CFP56_040111 [Quercus suber]|uniref:Uncharacterized protein n=1 Tax=Quercus suber TaxID=58331 RepID=A0AAW0LME7_QUESU
MPSADMVLYLAFSLSISPPQRSNLRAPPSLCYLMPSADVVAVVGVTVAEEKDWRFGDGFFKEATSGRRASRPPTAKAARIPEMLSCPPAPRKRRTTPRCHFNDLLLELYIT